MVAPESFLCGHRGGKMRIRGGKNLKTIEKKWPIFGIFFPSGGKRARAWGANAPSCPLVPPLMFIYIKDMLMDAQKHPHYVGMDAKNQHHTHM